MTRSINGEELQGIGIASQAAWSVQAGSSDLSITNGLSIVHAREPGGISLKQIRATGQLCLQGRLNI